MLSWAKGKLGKVGSSLKSLVKPSVSTALTRRNKARNAYRGNNARAQNMAMAKNAEAAEDAAAAVVARAELELKEQRKVCADKDKIAVDALSKLRKEHSSVKYGVMDKLKAAIASRNIRSAFKSRTAGVAAIQKRQENVLVNKQKALEDAAEKERLAIAAKEKADKEAAEKSAAAIKARTELLAKATGVVKAAPQANLLGLNNGPARNNRPNNGRNIFANKPANAPANAAAKAPANAAANAKANTTRNATANAVVKAPNGPAAPEVGAGTGLTTGGRRRNTRRRSYSRRR
jgi:hypothetical protein